MELAVIPTSTILDAFLVELVNVHSPENDQGASIDRFIRRFADLLPHSPEKPFEDGPPLGALDLIRRRVEYWRDQLRNVWAGTAQELREMNLLLSLSMYVAESQVGPYMMRQFDPRKALREIAEESGLHIDLGPEREPDVSEVPKPSLFVHVLRRAYRLMDRMRKCGNPACPAPYFLAVRRGQLYCSRICAGPAHQAVKNRWWKEKGKKWLEKRKADAKRRKIESRKKPHESRKPASRKKSQKGGK